MGQLHEYFRDTALNLAVFRIAVGALLLWLPDLHHAPDYAALPPSVLTSPVGLDVALVSPSLTSFLYPIAVLAIVAGLIGLYTRAAWLVASVSLLYLLAIPQFVGSAFHYHHLVWFAGLLAASPSGDALSVDAFLARRRGASLDRGRSLNYGVPIRAAWILIGIVFFFPGLHKLLTGGLAWAFSDNLRNQLFAKWLQRPGFEPLLRIDRYPTLLRLGAASVIALELGFVFLISSKWTRWIAVLGAFLFHQLTAYFMGLHFESLWICYVVFIDWSALVRWRRRKKGSPEPKTVEATEETRPRAELRPVLAMSLLLIVGNVGFGALGVSDGWPFACYPKFDRLLTRTELPALEIEVVRSDGSEEVIPVEAMSPNGPVPRWWALTWSLLGAHERATAEPARFEAFYEQMAQRPAVQEIAEGAVAVRFYRARVSTIPEDEARVLERRLMHEMPIE